MSFLASLFRTFAGQSSTTGHDSQQAPEYEPAIVAYTDVLQGMREFRTGRYDVLVRAVWIVAVAFAGGFLVDSNEVSRTIFYAGFMLGVPIFLLGGLLAWADNTLGMGTQEIRHLYLYYQFPSVTWPRHLDDIRWRHHIKVERNKYGHFSGVLTFVGASLGSIVLTWARGQQFSTELPLLDQVIIGGGAIVIVVQLSVVARLYRSMKRIAGFKEWVATETAQR